MYHNLYFFIEVRRISVLCSRIFFISLLNCMLWALITSFLFFNRVKGADTLSKYTSFKTVSSPFWKGSTLKGKNLLPEGANSFLLE